MKEALKTGVLLHIKKEEGPFGAGWRRIVRTAFTGKEPTAGGSKVRGGGKVAPGW